MQLVVIATKTVKNVVVGSVQTEGKKSSTGAPTVMSQVGLLRWNISFEKFGDRKQVEQTSLDNYNVVLHPQWMPCWWHSLGCLK